MIQKLRFLLLWTSNHYPNSLVCPTKFMKAEILTKRDMSRNLPENMEWDGIYLDTMLQNLFHQSLYFSRTVQYFFRKNFFDKLPMFSKSECPPPNFFWGGSISYFRLTLYKNSKRKYEMDPPKKKFGGGPL